MFNSYQINGNQNDLNSMPKIGTLIPNRIFVGGISSNTTEDELRDFFSIYGAIKDVKVIYDRTGLAKGSYGFVTFERQETAEHIIKNETDTIKLRDRKLNISYAVRKHHVVPRQISNGNLNCAMKNRFSLMHINSQECGKGKAMSLTGAQSSSLNGNGHTVCHSNTSDSSQTAQSGNMSCGTNSGLGGFKSLDSCMHKTCNFNQYQMPMHCCGCNAELELLKIQLMQQQQHNQQQPISQQATSNAQPSSQAQLINHNGSGGGSPREFLLSANTAATGAQSYPVYIGSDRSSVASGKIVGDKDVLENQRRNIVDQAKYCNANYNTLGDGNLVIDNSSLGMWSNMGNHTGNPENVDNFIQLGNSWTEEDHFNQIAFRSAERILREDTDSPSSQFHSSYNGCGISLTDNATPGTQKFMPYTSDHAISQLWTNDEFGQLPKSPLGAPKSTSSDMNKKPFSRLPDETSSSVTPANKQLNDFISHGDSSGRLNGGSSSDSLRNMSSSLESAPLQGHLDKSKFCDDLNKGISLASGDIVFM